MERFAYEIRPGRPDREIGGLLASLPAGAPNARFELHFNHNEELFLRLERPFRVPAFPIHHDVRDPEPSKDYLQALRSSLARLLPLLPAAFTGLSHFFDPTDTLRPAFYRLFKAEGSLYLFILRLDLGFRPQSATALKPGGNDFTAEFESRDLYLDSEIIPLDPASGQGGEPPIFRVREMISSTWIGETGKGYMRRGIWMDADLSKFFSKLFLPAGQTVYPYLPLVCKYRTVCQQCLRLDGEGRREALGLFHRQAGFLSERIPVIQAALKKSPFSEKMPEFADMRRRVPPAWLKAYSGIRVRSYINESDAKEYLLEY